MKKSEMIDKIKADLIPFQVAKSAAKRAEEEWRAMQPGLIDLFRKAKSASVTVSVDADEVHKVGFQRLTGTLVEGSTVVVNQERLKKLLGSARWSKVTTPTLDMAKLEAAVASGLITAEEVAECSDEVPKAAYIRVTVK